ncbi:MAG: 7,8-dihydropterin-6-yl-methyl-4-(beta-D-ribofuranosyl)aminobenzene 5-phosphate synthase [Clostridia bacterium]|nr:7,8-dihydropterin-6-yl-methyl-4-(beta-D-ribofuranosyl)aminobenzene 5-phosphate synthase [Clostridia bacterium]
MQEVLLTVLVENTTEQRGLLAEHGFAVLVEAGGKKILFDTGAGRALLPNAEALGVDLKSVDVVVLSHGHYDHTGGLKAFLEVHNPVDIYAHPDVFRERYRVETGKEPRYIGIPWGKEELAAWGAHFHLQETPVNLAEGVSLTGFIPRLTEYETVSNAFQIRSGDGFERDIIPDDQALVIHSQAGLVVLLGCAHAGLINTLRYVQSITGEKKICAVLGGTHLRGAGEERIARTLEALRDFGLDKIGVSHCTGFPASFAFYQVFGKRFFRLPVGTKFSL